tara:strand:- start:920 stop:1603 length:684 start_codon:yes stop_codon:yes gene_type:complete
LAKRLTENQKNEIIKGFINGITIDELSKKFECAKLTITRNLKKNLDKQKYDYFIHNNKSIKSNQSDTKKTGVKLIENKIEDNPLSDFFSDDDNKNNQSQNSDFFANSYFTEIAPLDYEINSETQRDLSSVSISKIDLPKIVYIIVDDKIELETKNLSDYPEWQFLSSNELKRKTIEIYFDLKIAKRFCTKGKKVIKVPNTNVFKIAAPILLSRGISRIVSPDNLISL